MVKRSFDERFWSKVDKSAGPDGCWLWTANKNRSDWFGYGRIFVSGKMLLAHRVSYGMAHGGCPDDMCVLHACDNPPCVNPGHLFLGTKQDNATDRDAKGRTGSVKGSENHWAKLDENAVRTIRGLHANGVARTNALCTYFNVERTTIKRILNGSRWRHILPNPPNLGDRARW